MSCVRDPYVIKWETEIPPDDPPVWPLLVVLVLAAIILGMLLGVTLCHAAAPPAVTDLRATLTPQTGIAWHLTIPAVNDSACAPDSMGEVVCSLPHRYAPATDSVTYHWMVYGLPPPYLRMFEDSTRHARGERVSRFYQDWRTTWHLGVATQHWFSREAAPPQAHRNESARVNRFFVVRDW